MPCRRGHLQKLKYDKTARRRWPSHANPNSAALPRPDWSVWHPCWSYYRQNDYTALFANSDRPYRWRRDRAASCECAGEENVVSACRRLRLADESSGRHLHLCVLLLNLSRACHSPPLRTPSHRLSHVTQSTVECRRRSTAPPKLFIFIYHNMVLIPQQKGSTEGHILRSCMCVGMLARYNEKPRSKRLDTCQSTSPPHCVTAWAYWFSGQGN